MSEATTSANPPTAAAPLLARNFAAERLLVWMLFLVSGACGLVYEVLWCRQLGLLFGNTAHSLSAVLTAFMSGLALGSFVAGRLCHRIQRPLLVYGVLEFLIGVYCALLPWFFGDHSPLLPLYRSLYGETGSGSLGAARFAISFALLLIPTTFMGATLPVLSHFLVRSRSGLGRTVGALYAINSFGAVLGAIAAGFYLLPELGKSHTNWAAVLCNILLGALAIAFGLKLRVNAEQSAAAEIEQATLPAEPATPISPRAVQLAVLTFGITGFAAMATQIGWTRAISLGTGSSTYAFSLIVAVFILGLSTGGSWGARAASTIKDPLTMLAKVLVMVGLTTLIVSVLLGYAPLIFFFLIAWGSGLSWPLLLLFQALGIALLIFLPTFLMGATMPLTIQVASRGSANTGRTVGTVYAVNTVGSILGSFLGGLLLLPTLQIQSTLEVMALLYALPGIVLFALSPSRRERRQLVLIGAMLIPMLVLGAVGSRWNRSLMSSGMYLMSSPSMVKAARELRIGEAIPNMGPDSDLLYYQEGTESSVAVMRLSGQLSLRVGGKPDASSHSDMITQVSLTLVPEILHSTGAEEVLVIGLGSGVSTGAALGPDSIKRVDVVEMSPQVVEASSLFQSVNRLTYTKPDRNRFPWLATPKVEVLINDGRNHLQLTSRKYDVIASEPSNPWMAGVGNLFTQEAFELCRSRLKPGGIMCQWIHSYRLENAHFLSVLHTFAKVFKHVQLWQARDADYMVIGSDTPLDVPLVRLRERLKQPGIANWLQSVRLDRAPDFMAGLVAEENQLRLLSKTADLHTDNNMLLEFQAPRSLFINVRIFNSANRISHPEKIMDFSGIASDDLATFLGELDKSSAAREHYRYAFQGPGASEMHQQAGFMLSPYQLWVAEFQNTTDQERARKLMNGEPLEKPAPNPVAAIAILKEVRERSKDLNGSPSALNFAIQLQVRQLIKDGKPDEALAEIATIDAPEYAAATELLRARALFARKDFDAAAKAANKALQLGGSPVECVEVAGRALSAGGRKPDALATISPLMNDPRLKSDPAASPLWALYAELLFYSGELEHALESVRLATWLDERNTTYELGHAQILNALKRPDEALHVLRLRAARDPMRAELKADLARALLVRAAAVQSDSPSMAADLRLHSRRVSREITVLQPKWPTGWELLCRTFLAVETCDAPRASFWHAQAQDAFAKLLALHQGDAAKAPADLVKALQPATAPPP